MIKREAKVHRLPTENGAIWSNEVGRLYSNKPYVFVDRWRSAHLYITTDEEIKEGDWFINTGSGGHPTPKVYQANSENSKVFKEFGPYPEIRKIIATTDPKLLVRECSDEIENWGKEFLPQIPQSFIEEYCKAGGIDEVLVEMQLKMETTSYSETGCGISTPINTGKPKLTPDNTIIIHPVEEKMYSVDVMTKVLIDFSNNFLKVRNQVTEPEAKKWIEENL